jgi:hypothetical protein
MLLTNYMLQKSNQTKLCLGLSKNEDQEIKWKQLIPRLDFGWSGTHLSQTEKVHFFMIEKLVQNQPTIFETELQKISLTNNIQIFGTKTQPKLFISKSNFTKNEILFNEVIGNYIRTYELPNLSYCFGILNHLNTKSMINEYQRNSMTLDKYLLSSDYNFNDFVFILIQLFNIEFYLYQIAKYSHNDFHLENIIIRPTNQNKWKIPLISLKTHQIILTDKIAVIIDMGLVTFYINDELNFPNKSAFASILSDLYFMLQRIDTLIQDKQTKDFLQTLDGFNQFLLQSLLPLSLKTQNLSFLFSNKLNSRLFDENDIRIILNQPENIQTICESLIKFIWNFIPNEFKNDNDGICPKTSDIKTKDSGPSSNKKRKFI